MPEVDALKAATSAPADFLDPDAGFGRIGPGMRADLLLVRGDPSVDIQALSAIEEVFLDGVRLRREGVRDSQREPSSRAALARRSPRRRCYALRERPRTDSRAR